MRIDDRAARRAQWPIRRYRLGAEPSDDLSLSSTAEQRLRMLASLSEEAWALAGRRARSYGREQTPAVVSLRRGRTNPHRP